MMTKNEMLKALAGNGGAILTWQVPDPSEWDVAYACGEILYDAENDLWVHPGATDNGDGSYSMPELRAHGHDLDDAGRCRACGEYVR